MALGKVDPEYMGPEIVYESFSVWEGLQGHPHRKEVQMANRPSIQSEDVFFCRQLLTLLSEDQHEVILRMFFRNQTAKKISGEMKISPKNVAILMADAIQIMREGEKKQPPPPKLSVASRFPIRPMVH